MLLVLVEAERCCVAGESERKFCDLLTMEEITRNEAGGRHNENEAVLTKVPYKLRNFRDKSRKALGRVVCIRLT